MIKAMFKRFCIGIGIVLYCYFVTDNAFRKKCVYTVGVTKIILPLHQVFPFCFINSTTTRHATLG